MIYKILKNQKKPNDDFFTYFDISYDNNPTIKSNFLNIWKRVSNNKLENKYEDLLIFAISIYSLDKKILRKNFDDGWTRNINAEIPVLNLQLWNSIKYDIERLMCFLTGDIWNISFYKTEERYYHNRKNNKRNLIEYNFDIVSLFSGGLDSFCGSILLAQQYKNILFIGHEEYPKLNSIQNNLLDELRKEYLEGNFNLISFTASQRERNLKSEDTCRSRSLMFIAFALVFSTLNTNCKEIYIPENGFVGLNIPLTKSRISSCSTRTTHPYFINNLNEILAKLGIDKKIVNPFFTTSKNKMVEYTKGHKSFINSYDATYSCSHPALARYYKLEYPKNCGYCYPCLIRRASLIGLDDKTKYWYDINDAQDSNEVLNSKKNQSLIAIRDALNRFDRLSERELKDLIAGNYIDTNIEEFYQCYCETIKALKTLFKKSKIDISELKVKNDVD